MHLSASTADTYLRHEFTQLLPVADRLGEPVLDVRPLGPHTDALAGPPAGSA